MQIRIVESEPIVIQPAILMKFLARKPIAIHIRQRPPFASNVSVRIVEIPRFHILVIVHKNGDIARAVAVVKGGSFGIRSSEQPANAVCGLQSAAKIQPPCVGDEHRVVGIPLLNHQIAVIHITGFGCQIPGVG